MDRTDWAGPMACIDVGEGTVRTGWLRCRCGRCNRHSPTSRHGAARELARQWLMYRDAPGGLPAVAPLWELLARQVGPLTDDGRELLASLLAGGLDVLDAVEVARRGTELVRCAPLAVGVDAARSRMDDTTSEGHGR